MKSKARILFLGLLIFFNVVAILYLSKTLKQDRLKVYFFNIGQGDSIFIETQNNKQILIDGGPDKKVIQKLSKVMPFWDRTIDLIILTHPQNDHMIGLLEVLKRYKVAGIVETGVFCEKIDCLVWEELKEKEKAIIIKANIGQKIILDKNTEILILHPFENLSKKVITKLNNTSVVAKLIYGSHSILLTGDIEKQVEEKLILSGVNLKSEYLKIAHHGSKTSTTEEFLNMVSPKEAVMSLGLNRYGHPNKEVIDLLEKKSIKYYRTDKNGDILITCLIKEECKTITQK